ncbi:bifunctional DNA-formamidopyrimidine glycosylase/DNA-(apurinic or apyrimidinic site) lyase [Pseudodesulfovibrio piezophilus]|uniref:Formamidopyrimidine-DNA glycosylase n=1 Tax=Pseudodesulfovibrio piezophilus (strain DSM 21447 / JCM 15486 / C1TLV30) TaxID=1322246 RepID=M1WX74_PSEP2|nr:bifunctional DNA-formamidopyrimidine glycosylase/DNA-(apurinic or apyrimidinic site) lyase [Pseudodesulfovibrio piezophilus]CCH49563.1 Formamidopyrimidine-DNA glycosylase [Pseudodesulfovibrio piezophilus C1TLV30]
MPELPEVEVIARGLDSTLPGRRIALANHVDLTRLSEPAATLLPRILGRRIVRAYRRAKVLLIELSEGMTMAFHLKMTGRVVHGPTRRAQKHDRLFLSLDDGSLLSFSDMRKFGYVRSFTAEELGSWCFLEKCGPEPLETSPRILADRLEGRKGKIKALLLNQSVVVGVGNIYADESLFHAGIHPETPGNIISLSRRVSLFTKLQSVLKQAIAENGSSIRNYVNADGDAGAFQNNFTVYGRKGEPCRTCKSVLEVVKVAGRSSTFCPRCQRRNQG